MNILLVGYNKDINPSVHNYKNLLQKKCVPTYKILYKFLDVFITLFQIYPLLIPTNLHQNMKNQH
jgi:hypothetical protein